MSDSSTPANTEDLAATEYDAKRGADLAQEQVVDSNAPLPVKSDVPEVGLSQKGTDENAIVKGETDVC